jgi:DNA-binding LytR/AlgR family response regulator
MLPKLQEGPGRGNRFPLKCRSGSANSVETDMNGGGGETSLAASGEPPYGVASGQGACSKARKWRRDDDIFGGGEGVKASPDSAASDPDLTARQTAESRTSSVRPAAESFQHKLEQFNPGIVWLDAENRVTAMNDVAIQVLRPAAEPSLGVSLDAMFGVDVLALHPPKSREKIAFLLGHLTAAPDGKSPPPQAMMINIPDRMLMIKVSRMVAADGHVGTCMIFYDLTEVTTAPRAGAGSAAPGEGAPGEGPMRLISRIPVYRHNRIVLVDVKDIGRLEGEGHYTTIVTQQDRYLSNLSLSVLESRLDPARFLRVHRSHIVNLDYVTELVRQDEGFLVALPEALGPAVPVSKQKLHALKERFGLV